MADLFDLANGPMLTPEQRKRLAARPRKTGHAAPPGTGPEGERPIDRGIAHAVKVLWDNGVETFESCEGGSGHPFPEPTIRFHGGSSAGFKALDIALQHGLKVAELRRYWDIIDQEPHGPYWEMTFFH